MNRLLVVTCHYFGHKPEQQSHSYFSSQIEPLARIAAVNASLVALHRHFGPRRHGADASRRVPGDLTPRRELDIVVLQMPGRSLLEAIQIDPACYTVENFDGPPLMMCFEAQRILRERAGGYDYYAVIEDDIVIHDPLFFEKLSWFERTFGPSSLLAPSRYEMAQSGTPAIVINEPILSSRSLAPFRRDGQKQRLTGIWHDQEQSFALPSNPHASGYFLSDAQLRHWLKAPWFYDRDASWIGPIESAMNLALGRSFDVYKPFEPDPFFLSVEHYGTRYARTVAPPGVHYGDTPLLEIAYAAMSRAAATDRATVRSGGQNRIDELLATSRTGLNALVNERDQILGELLELKQSRTRLLQALWSKVKEKGWRW